MAMKTHAPTHRVVPGITEPGVAVPLLVGAWLLLRVVFFEGLWGYDDLYHVHFAMRPRVPIDVWEGRLFYNALLIAAYRLFGAAEWALALPTMLSSLGFVLVTWWAARRLAGDAAGLLAGLLAATCAQDVAMATDPIAAAQENAFAAAGTALALTGRPRLAGAAFGAAIASHLTAAFYFGPFLLAFAAFGDRRRIPALLGAAIGTYVLLDPLPEWILSGDPLHYLHLVQSTHLEHQPYTLPPFLPSGAWNPAWFWWPPATFLFSKAFGLLLSLPVGFALLRWRRIERVDRLLVVLILGGWAWINWGTQLPYAYQPLNHQVRYWYPLAMPACVLAARMVRHVRRRRAWAAVLLAPGPLLLLASGSWGQNVEISRELMAYAQAHPERAFATDAYTYDEMLILSDLAPPPNVTVLPGDAPEFGHPPAGPPENAELLVNALQLGRPKAARLERLLAAAERAPISAPTWRTFAYLLPERMRAAHPSLMRRPPAEVAHVASPRP
jgi:hypothetical protein